MEDELTIDELNEWLSHPCTKKFLVVLDDNCKMTMNSWGTGAYTDPDPMAGAVRNAEYLGQYRALKSMADLFANRTILPVVKRNTKK